MCSGMNEQSNSVTALAKEFFDQHTKQQNSMKLSPRDAASNKHTHMGVSDDLSNIELLIASYNTSLSPAVQLRLIAAIKEDQTIIKSVGFSTENVCLQVILL